ncbi:ABC transporter substrate-binding protein [Halomonas nitroreducens]|uniref:ABC transporter substrate-binding protein n=1 Tax=Halomonas nitroreducens TaxID=447425 RepID=A0A3S0JY40_9GAMM|nr:ABC transporter substrate-binding protein [Halomonas nitroreducens]RTR05884.1 ABC transporter substrate-binding protein [Halomonas nitroreducens]
MRGLWLLGATLILVGMVAVALHQPAPSSAPAMGQESTAADLRSRRGALVDQVVFTREDEAGRVTGLIEAGTRQVFTQGISNPGVFRRLRDSLAAGYDLSYGTSSELTLNPAGPELADGSLNPFHVPAIREALNRLVDRDYIAQELYGGLAEPRFLPLSTAFPDYTRLAATARELELRYAHDPDAAREVIHREMAALGAQLREGVWHYENEPVRLIVLIRTEDQRRQVGDYAANLLAEVGFVVERRYRTAEEASRIWIATDPRAGRWHLYTGGWISIVIQRDQAEVFSFYYTPRGRAEPLWQAYEPAPAFDELAERLQRRDYRNWEQRQAMMARALELAMQDSVRIWLVDQLNASARAANVEVAVDLAGGLAGSALWPYTLRYADRVGGRMVFGTPGLLTEPWNPVAGSNWIFDQMIMRATQDPVALPDPFTGLFRPQRIARAAVTVQDDVTIARSLDWLSVSTAEEIVVPEAAWIDWDVEAGRFVSVGEAHDAPVTARTRVRVRYDADLFEQRWHDGSPLSLADFVLPWILTFERADEASRLFDPAYLPTFEVFRRHFRGWHLVSRDPLVIEIYSDQGFPDAETLVATRAPAPQPWHALALGVFAERQGELAFSSNKADRRRVDWMSLVAGPSVPILARHLEWARDRTASPFPGMLDELLDEEEITARYRALADWHAKRGHFWIGNGPFLLDSVHPVAGSLVLERFRDFPDPADKWQGFTRPAIPELDLDGPLVTAPDPADGAGAATFRLAVTLEGKPYPPQAIDRVQFLLFDGRGTLVERGEAEPSGDPGRWRIAPSPATLAALGVGANRLEVAVTSHRVALPAFASHVFATVPPGGTEASP